MGKENQNIGNKIPSNERVIELLTLYNETFEEVLNKILTDYNNEKQLQKSVKTQWFNKEFLAKLAQEREGFIEEKVRQNRDSHSFTVFPNLFKKDLVVKFKDFADFKYNSNAIENFIINDIPKLIADHQDNLNIHPNEYLWDLDFILKPDYSRIIKLIATYNSYHEAARLIELAQENVSSQKKKTETQAKLVSDKNEAPITINQPLENKTAANLETIQIPERKLLTRKQIADKFDVTLPTIDAWRKQGFLICRRIGSRVYFLEDEVYKNMPSNERFFKKMKG